MKVIHVEAKCVVFQLAILPCKVQSFLSQHTIFVYKAPMKISKT